MCSKTVCVDVMVVVLTQTRAAGEEALVKVLIVDGDCLDERGTHARHPNAQPGTVCTP